jgi:anaerobic magnesium-protoporphyrin IX monomethyl ester cyclase
MIDSLLIGYNEMDFASYLDAVRRMGTDHVSYRVVSSGFIEYQNRPYRCMDILNRFHWEGREERAHTLHSFDFLQPVVTYLGSFLRRHGFTFDYVNIFQLEKEKLAEKLRREDYRTVAITTTFYETSDPIREIIELVRRCNQNVRIVVGGPHIAYQMKLMDPVSAQYFFRHIGADAYVISSEGETAFAALLAAWRDGGSLAAVDNIAFREGDGYVVTRSVPESNSLEDNPVDYTLFPPAELSQFVSLRTSKSCPFRCSFCDFPSMAGKYTYTPVEVVERELDALRDLGFVTTLSFLDDTFNVPKKRFKELLRMMIRNRYDFRWNCFYRADHGDAECVELMAGAGCEGVFMGVESGSDKMLGIMNKTARQQDYATSIPLLRQAGILTYASLITGFPGETDETVAETTRFLEEVQPDFYQTNIWYCHPATPIYAERDKYGIRGSAYNWAHATMDSRQAADHVERTIMAVQGSIWLPYYFWNVFYLQRLGMTLDQMKDFIRSFNGIVKEKMVDPRRTADDSLLLGTLRRACQFDRPFAGEPGPVETLTGASYAAAEQFWVEEVRGVRAEAADPEEAAEWGPETAADVETAALSALCDRCGAEPGEVLLAASAVLFAGALRRDDLVVIASLEGLDRGFLPLRLALPPQASFRAVVAEVSRARQRAEPHAGWGLYLVSNPDRMAVLGGACPPLPGVFAWLEDGEASASALLGELARACPAAAPGIETALVAAGRNGGIQAAAAQRQTLAAGGAPWLAAFLRAAASEPDRPVADLEPALWGPRAGGFPAAAGPVSTHAPGVQAG